MANRRFRGYLSYALAMLLCYVCAYLPVYAQQRAGLGGVATNIMDPVTVFSGFVNSACLVIGGAFLFASIIKYVEYRRSPTMVPLSTVIFLLIAGLVLVALPLLSFIAEGGIPFTILND